VDCKGFREVMGLANSVDLISPIASGIMISTTGDEGGVDLLDLRGVLGLLSRFYVCKASSFCEDPSVS
jgi:hypothetical protein